MDNADIVQVDTIANDEQKLKEKAEELCGEPVGIDTEKIGKDLESVDSSVRAILVRKNGGGGAVRVYGSTIRNVLTGPTEGAGFVIVIIRNDETCRLFGNPSVRYFRRSGS